MEPLLDLSTNSDQVRPWSLAHDDDKTTGAITRLLASPESRDHRATAVLTSSQRRQRPHTTADGCQLISVTERHSGTSNGRRTFCDNGRGCRRDCFAVACIYAANLEISAAGNVHSLHSWTAFGKLPATLARVEQIKAFAMEHVSDPNLSVQRIAEGLHTSISTIHRAFVGEALSVMSWVWAMRLIGARRDLSNLKKSHLNITDIAFSWGFSDAAHFSRSFRACFGRTPRAHREGSKPICQ